MNLEERIAALKLIGLTYDETTRYFTGQAGKIDQDVVQYGSEALFNMKYEKCKSKYNAICSR
jgi:hypothetical protein